jgi:hypothetical protein
MNIIDWGTLAYNLLHSTIFWIVVAIWVIILIAWTARSKALMERISNLIKKPVIFRPDQYPENVPLYPRTFFEQVAAAIKDKLAEPFKKSRIGFAGWIKNNLHPLIYESQHPFRMPASLLFLVLFGLFVVADIIAVANTLKLLDLYAGQLTGWLGRYDLAVLGGSLGALLVGFIIFFELFEKESVFTDLSERATAGRYAYRGFAVVVMLLAIVSLVTWALARQIALGQIEATPSDTNLVNWVLYGIVPINSALAAAITFMHAFKGIVVIFTIICWILVAIIWLLDWAVTILGSVVPFLFDVAYRLLHIILDILQWLISTPILGVLQIFKWFGSLFTPNQTEHKE